jgi:hypothetical protein
MLRLKWCPVARDRRSQPPAGDRLIFATGAACPVHPVQQMSHLPHSPGAPGRFSLARREENDEKQKREARKKAGKNKAGRKDKGAQSSR